ncbi:MAG: PD40 domain-containing protein, partial [Myxococcales bacterium]|nr:PD40 domain-containing protein [Myxococcales bacterium]
MRRRIVAVFSIAAFVAACEEPEEPASSYFDERIAPVLRIGCVEQTAGCHLAAEDGTATGNLDLSSYDALMRRSDVLAPYGPYPVGLLLLKGGEAVDVQVDTLDPPDPSKPDERFVRITTDIRHNAGTGIGLSSRSYNILKQWIGNGHTRSGTPSEEQATNLGSCRAGAGTAPGFDPDKDPDESDSFRGFRDQVQPVLRETCAGGNCHGSPISDMYLACGDTEEELRWNFFVAVEHLADPASTSEILRRPLATARGGTFHEGGTVFGSTEDGRYQTLRSFAENFVETHPEALVPEEDNEGFRFFANRVQPVLVRKGCAFLNCHSSSMFHDFRFRGGSQGVFSRAATRRNYEMSQLLLATESEDPNDSRLIAKNLYPPEDVEGGAGMAHRGGFLLEDFGVEGQKPKPASADLCDDVDADTGDLNTIPAYCVLARWHAIERDERIASGELTADPVSGLAWVARPDGIGDVRDFHTYRPGADLRFATVTLDAEGAVTMGTPLSLLDGCGLPASVDVRTPAVSWDGTRIAFAVRSDAEQPLRLYGVDPDGANCEPLEGVAPDEESRNGILLHDFDPAFAPDGRLVFASTRGHLGEGYSYDGPTLTPASLAPNANLYVFDPEDGAVRELTFLLNQEVAPSFMADGRVILTAEKREREFHQLAGRRINLDGGDYHPLYAQRPSIGFASATEFVEAPNHNLVFVAGPLGATDGAGAIAIVNRSIGPDQDDRDPSDRSYIHSLSIPVPGALGGMDGAFRSPVPLPGGRILAACDEDARSLTAKTLRFELCEIDPRTGTVRVVGGEAGQSNVDLALVYARPNHGVFESRIDEVNGHTEVVPDQTDAVIHVQDFPLLATLLFSNTREGRPIRSDIGGVEILEALPPPSTA